MSIREPHPEPALEVIASCVFAGKTKLLLNLLELYKIGEVKVQLFKPKIDTRYSKDEVVCHNQKNRMPAINFDQETPMEIIDLVDSNTKVVGIDEVQFCHKTLVPVVIILVGMGKRVIVAGLGTDFQQKPFEVMAELLAIADERHQPKAVCNDCRRAQATISVRIDKTLKKRVVLGSKGVYEPLCRTCFNERRDKN